MLAHHKSGFLHLQAHCMLLLCLHLMIHTFGIATAIFITANHVEPSSTAPAKTFPLTELIVRFPAANTMAGATGRPRGRPRKTSSATFATSNIQNFARVSKQTPVSDKTLSDKNDALPTSTPGRKRKAARSPEPEETATTPRQRAILPVTTKTFKKTRVHEPIHLQEQVPSTPRHKSTKKRALSPSLEESPRTKEAGNLFKRLRIDSSPSIGNLRTPSPLITTTTTGTTRTSTPATSVIPDSDDEKDAASSNATTPEPEQPLPQELLDIVALYTAFLKTIVLHYAHNGTNTPVDLRSISQAVSLAWGKRRISLADVRRCVGIMDMSNASPFYLVDYGNKKFCVELQDEHYGSPLNEAGLLGTFEGNLRKAWDKVKDAASGEDLKTFVMSLPKAPVQSREALAKSAALARGQRVMQDLKADMAAKQELKDAAKIQSTSTSGSNLSLLERLRLKETQLASLAANGPTSAELERRAALQRADDVSAVVAMLAKSAPAVGMGGRVSFTMATVLQKLKDSLRLPISKEEAVACVRLLAGEVVPEWLRIVVVAGKENVVVTMGRAPTSSTVMERVKVLSA